MPHREKGGEKEGIQLSSDRAHGSTEIRLWKPYFRSAEKSVKITFSKFCCAGEQSKRCREPHLVPALGKHTVQCLR